MWKIAYFSTFRSHKTLAKHSEFRDFTIFSFACIFFLLVRSLLWSFFFFSSLLWLFPPLLFDVSIWRMFGLWISFFLYKTHIHVHVHILRDKFRSKGRHLGSFCFYTQGSNRWTRDKWLGYEGPIRQHLKSLETLTPTVSYGWSLLSWFCGMPTNVDAYLPWIVYGKSHNIDTVAGWLCCW